MKTTILFLSFLIFTSTSSYAEVPLFKVNTRMDELPREFYDLDERLYKLEKRPYEVVVVLTNDIGLGDDYGHTHSFKVVGVTKLKNGIRLRVSYSTDLYTEKIGEKNEDGLTPQHFMDENLGKFMADNIDAGNLFYWKGEVGWHQLSDVYKKNIFRGSSQQVFFHKLIHPYIPQKQPLNVSEGYGTKNGAMGSVSVGIHKKYKSGPLEVSPRAEIGVSKSTLKGADHKYASVSLEATYVVKPEYRMNVIAEAQAKKHATGTQRTYSVHANVESKRWVVGAGVYQDKGTLDNHTRYNRPNSNGKVDPIYMIYGSYRFGRGSKSEPNILKSRELLSK